MKRKYLRRGFSGLMAIVMMLTMLISPKISQVLTVSAEPATSSSQTQTVNEIHWSFENGALSPFKVTDGEFGVGIIANWITERNAPYGVINKDGDYYLSTVETDTTATANESYVGTIVSPTFSIKDPTVTMKLGGGSLERHPDGKLYVAIVRDSDGKELVKYSLPKLPEYSVGGTVYKSGHMFTDISLTIPDTDYVEGEVVYIKIVDGATSGWGFITVDDIKAKGDICEAAPKADLETTIPTTYGEVAWAFETGTMAPFTTDSAWPAGLICSLDVNYNNTTQANNKQGTYFLNTVLKAPDGNKTSGFDESYTGNLTSPCFVLDPNNTTISLKIGGGKTSGVTIYDYNTKQAVGSATVTTQGWVFNDTTITWNDGFTYTEGQLLYMQIEDRATKSYGFVSVDDIRFNGAVVSPYETIRWDFETGTMAPFTTTATWPAGMISSLDYDYNTLGSATLKTNNKQGKYFLNTVLKNPLPTAKNAHDESYIGNFVSPVFALNPDNTTITLKIGGGSASGVFVYDYNTNQVVGSATVTTRGWVFNDATVKWNDGFTYTEGQLLYMKIEDRATSSYGFVSVDDIRFSGQIIENEKYKEYHWSFEDGTTSPFTTTSKFVSKQSKEITNFINDYAVDWNGSGASMNQDGQYYMSTIGVKGTLETTYSEYPTGEFVSSAFVLDPDRPTVSFRIGGGNSAQNYVAICDARSGEVLAKASPFNQTGSKHPLVATSLTVENYVAGTPVVIKIVDGTSSGWGFLHVDDFRFFGEEVSYTYAETIWSFENGTMFPFTTEATWGNGLISTFSSGTNKWHGKYYLNTVQEVPNAGSPYNEGYVGEFVSPKFMLNPDDPIITLQINGGSANYVAVYNADSGEELAKVNPTKSWNFADATLDLTGKFNEGDLLVLKIVDCTEKSWAWIGVDNIRGSFAFPEEKILTTITQVMDATGWYEEDFELLLTMIEDHLRIYSEEDYPEGEDLLKAVIEMQTAQSEMAIKGVKEDSDELNKWIEEMDALAHEIYVTNPVLGSGLMIFTVHYQYRVDHHNTHNMFPSYNGEISDKGYFTPGGAVKVLNLRTGEVTTLLEDADGLYRDLDISYDANKILLSYREDRNSTYNIVEYTLSADKLSITNTKQLTSLSTADDMDPLYMPSGNIVFSSTRDPKYVMCNRHIAGNLYRMEADGANIVKITSSTLFERPSDVLPDGRILYDRWEYNDRDFGSAQGLWTVYEDGTKQDTYYGNNSPTGAVIDAKAIPGTQKVIAVLSSTHDVAWGALAIIDRSEGVDGQDPVEKTWPANVIDKIGDPGDSLNIDAYLGLSVKYEDPQPLSEDYFLASRMIDGKGQKMGIYLLDTYGNEILLYEDESDMSAFDATIIQTREEELETSSRRNYKDEVGAFFVQDVYEGTHMEGVERGSVVALRIVESVDKKYITQSSQWKGEGQQNPGVNWHSFEVKRVIGEVPVYEDGSAYFEVPQDVFVYFQLLDKDGKVIQSMRSGTLVQSGETTGCVGCHEDRRTAPKTNTGQDTPMALKANIVVIDNPDYVEGSNLPKTIAVNTPDVPQKRIINFENGTDSLVDWNDESEFSEYTDLPTMNFLTEVQPIFTKNCLECHGYDKQEANLSLVPDKDVIFNAAYINLWVNRGKSGVMFGNLVGAVGGGGTSFYNAMSWGSYNSPLIDKIFNDENHKNLLTDAEKRRIAEWVDLNATYYGDYTTNYGYNDGSRSPLTAAERAALGDNRSMVWSGLTLASLEKAIYFDNPSKSPILKGKTGDEYTNALAIIQAGLDRLRINPDVDWKGLTSVPGNTSLSINPYKQNAMDAWRTEKVALYDAMEAANRAAIVNGTKLYDSDHEAVMAAHNAKWPGWPTVNNTGNAYTVLLN